MIPELPSAVPGIPVADITTATAYYRDNLHFSLDWLAAEIDLAGVSRDHCRLFLAGPRFREGRGTGGPVVTWLNLNSAAAVDHLHQAWRGSDAILLSDPQTKPWGLHEFFAADLDGNLFRVFHDVATPARERARAIP